jgi:hypothetical protein
MGWDGVVFGVVEGVSYSIVWICGGRGTELGGDVERRRKKKVETRGGETRFGGCLNVCVLAFPFTLIDLRSG